MRRRLGMLVAAALVAGCSGAVTEREIAAEPDGGLVRVRTHRDWQHVEITSPKGIGGAEIPLAQPPRPLRLAFHLHGLEQLRFSYGDVEIVVAVGADGSVRERAQQPDGVSRTLAEGDALWMPVRIERAGGAGGQAPIARIEIEGPAALRDAATPSFRIEWVDFFR
jgi:hypothetical protein